MKYEYDLTKEAAIALLIFSAILILCYVGVIVYQIVINFREDKKKKVVKGKKITLETYNKLQEYNIKEIKRLEATVRHLEEERSNLIGLVRLIREKRIDLIELEKLGLQRYNATYGKRAGFACTFITDREYEILKKYNYINYYTAWREIK